MTNESDLKYQRDRFLAFAFASADLLVEIDRSGKILFSTGATRSLLGHDDTQIFHKNIKNLFLAQDGNLLDAMFSKPKGGAKQGPYLVSLKNSKEGSLPQKVFVTGFSMPGVASLYMAIQKGDGLLRILGFEKEENEQTKIATAKEFETILEKRIPELMAQGRNADVTLLQLDGLKKHKNKLDKDTWENFMSSIAETIMADSLDGETAANLEDGRYMIMREQGQGLNTLQDKLKEVAKSFNMQDAFTVQSKTMEGGLDELSEREAKRAILYTMQQMEKDGIEKSGTDLKKSFKAFLEENSNKIKNIKNIISHQKFKIHFQPIVDMKTTKVVHHEVLMRFDDATSPYEFIVLGEDVGIAPDIDISVCRQAIKYADQHKKTNVGKLAVNISGMSIQNEMFVQSLLKSLDEYPDAAKHIMFELTESSTISKLDMVDGFIQKLRQKGHQVCLDDFGAGAASFQYLHKLHVDGVKIDGAYIKTILTSPRDATMIKNITQMCHEMDVFVVAEMIETEEQARYLRDIGVDKGQGWLYGKAQPDVLPIG